ncbi:hypothetical protein QL285_041122 [Trifolium repens]|nr:hypothetical protein QL285_041122 [Trifolium repens]
MNVVELKFVLTTGGSRRRSIPSQDQASGSEVQDVAEGQQNINPPIDRDGDDDDDDGQPPVDWKLIVYFRMKILDSDEDDSCPKRIIYAEKRAEDHAEKSKERRRVRIFIYFIFVYESGSCSMSNLRIVYESIFY